MSNFMDVLKESIDSYNDRVSSVKTVLQDMEIYDSVIESTLDEMFELELADYATDIKKLLVEENNIFWVNESASIELNPLIEFDAKIKAAVERCISVLNSLESKCKEFFDSQERFSAYVKEKDVRDMFENNTKDIYFPQEFYQYTNLRDSVIRESILIKFLSINRYIHTSGAGMSDYSGEFDLSDENVEEDNSLFTYDTRKALINKLMEIYGMKEKQPPQMIPAKDIYAKYLFISPIFDEDNNDRATFGYSDTDYNYYDLKNNYLGAIDAFKGNIINYKKAFKFDNLEKYIFNTKFKAILTDAYNKIERILNVYVLDFTTRLEAIMGYITTNNAMLTEAINQMTNSYWLYDVPSDINDDVNDKIDFMNDLKEVNEALIYADSVIALESAGLITVTEETRDKIVQYFNKISMGMTQIIEKIGTTIRKKIAEKLTPIIAKIKSPDKPDPEFNIKNSKSFDFTKVDTIKPEKFQYEIMKDALKSRTDFIERYYPMLREITGENGKKEKSFYKIMLNSCMTQVTSVTCTSRLIDDYTKFLTEEYALHLDGLEEFRAAIDDAGKQAANIANVQDQTVQRDMQNFEQQQQAQPTESAQIVDEADTTKFEDTSEAKDKGQGDTNLMRASTLYCSIMANILSGRIKVLNYVYNDRLKIVLHYAVKNKFNVPEQQQQQQ